MPANTENPYLRADPEYPCPQCDELFSKTAELYQHMRAEHSRPNRCHVCGHYFSALASLLSHSYIHSGATPFCCGYPGCAYSTKTKQNIQVHMHFCPKCPAQKYRVPFPLHERYRSTYKYQCTLTEHRENLRKQSKAPNRTGSKRKRKTKRRRGSLCFAEHAHSPRKIRNWFSDDQSNAEHAFQTPPSKRCIKSGAMTVDKPGSAGWRLEMHKAISPKQDIVREAMQLIATQLNKKYTKATCQHKGLHIAVLRDSQGSAQSAAILNTKDDGDYIEIKSFATAHKHKRQNLGTLLAAFVLERCHGKVVIAARDDFGVLSFWSSLGFRQCPRGCVTDFRRKGVIMMHTVAPYVGVHAWALKKFAPNSVVKRVLFKDKQRDDGLNTVTRTSISLVARLRGNEEKSDSDSEEVDSDSDFDVQQEWDSDAEAGSLDEENLISEEDDDDQEEVQEGEEDGKQPPLKRIKLA